MEHVTLVKGRKKLMEIGKNYIVSEFPCLEKDDILRYSKYFLYWN